MKHATFLKSAAVLTLGGFISKAIGALYRVPLANLLGGYGMGLYQMAYPLFCLLLTYSSAGIPAAFSRMIARERARGISSENTVRAALKLFFALGAAGTLVMCAFAPLMSDLQGGGDLLFCYFLLAPSVFLVALIAVFRGYFQGKNDMTPTAVSEILEQIFKAGAGLFFAYRFRETPQLAAAYALLAVTISEVFALLYLFVRYKGERHVKSLAARTRSPFEILAPVLPVMAATAILPLSQMADSVLIVRLLGGEQSAVSLYGLYSGGALSLIGLPATICYGFAAACVPAVSSAVARGDAEEGRRRALFALFFTLFLAFPCAVGLFLFADKIVAILYGGLSAEHAAILVRLVKIMSVSAVSLSGIDTLAACLTGMGRAKFAALSMLIAVSAKTALQFALVKNPAFGISGAAIAANACYLIAFFLDLGYTVKKTKERREYDHDSRVGNGSGELDTQGIARAQGGGRGARAHFLSFFRKNARRGRDCV